MKYLETDWTLTMTAESQADVDYLRKEYPHIKHGIAVTLAKKPDTVTTSKRKRAWQS